MVPPEAFTGTLKFLSMHPRTKTVFLPIVTSYVVIQVVKYLWARKTSRDKMKKRRDLAAKRKAMVEEQISQEQSFSDIVEKSASELVEALKNGSVTAVQVLQAYQQKALELTKAINCVIEPIVEAKEQANMLDGLSKKEGLLHGIPISVKDNISISGYDSTAGLSIHIGKNAKEDSLVVQVLKKHGAIPFIRTNIPQTMLSYCCSNPLYGETVNPQDRTRGPGGSSGGEGAVIGGGASVFGIGSDIGGSLRVPAEFCGIYALKPTKGRISGKGVYSVSRGSLAIQSVIGPMARDLDSLILLSRALMSHEMIELDRTLPDLPFNMQEFEKSTHLRIGYYTYDGNIQCQPAVVRAVMEAKAALEHMGHELVPFNFHSMGGCEFQNDEYFIHLMVADRGEKIKKLLGHDDVEMAVKPLIKLGKLPKWLVRFAAFLVRRFDKLSASVIGAGRGYESICEYFEYLSKFLDWQQEFMRAWVDMGLDAVICPVFPSPAVSRKIIPYVSVCGAYCQLYNSLNYPVGVMPVTKVSQEDLDKTFNRETFKARSSMEKLLLKSSQGSLGLSVGVQCVALPFREEMCLRVMRELQSGLQRKEGL